VKKLWCALLNWTFAEIVTFEANEGGENWAGGSITTICCWNTMGAQMQATWYSSRLQHEIIIKTNSIEDKTEQIIWSRILDQKYGHELEHELLER
jgi:hypothetical protein